MDKLVMSTTSIDTNRIDLLHLPLAKDSSEGMLHLFQLQKFVKFMSLQIVVLKILLIIVKTLLFTA